MERKRFCITGLLIFFCLFISTFQVEGDNYLILEYSTYLGGNGTEGHGILFFNSSDQLIVVSETSSTNYPLLNPYQNSNHGVRDITISLHAWKENILTYSTFFGGDGDDFVSRAIMNSKGQIIMVGVTDSSDFPLINSLAINSTGRDVFIVIFDPQISNFTFSSLLGSASNYYGINVCIDSSNISIALLGDDICIRSVSNEVFSIVKCSDLGGSLNSNSVVSDWFITSSELDIIPSLSFIWVDNCARSFSIFINQFLLFANVNLSYAKSKYSKSELESLCESSALYISNKIIPWSSAISTWRSINFRIPALSNAV